MTQTADSQQGERSTTSRRTVLKAGAHAAWAVPAVTIVTSAPAFAASGSNQCANLKLRVHTTTISGKNAHNRRVVYNIWNSSNDPIAVSITAHASSNGASLGPRRSGGFTVTPSGANNWSITGTARHGGSSFVLTLKGGDNGGQLSGALSDTNGNTCGGTAYSVSY